MKVVYRKISIPEGVSHARRAKILADSVNRFNRFAYCEKCMRNPISEALKQINAKGPIKRTPRSLLRIPPEHFVEIVEALQEDCNNRGVPLEGDEHGRLLLFGFPAVSCFGITECEVIEE